VEGAFSEVGRTGALRCGALALLFVAGQDGYKTLSYNRGKDSRMGRDSRKDKNEGTLDKAKGRAKEAAGSLTGNKDRKAEGQADQDKGTLKKKKGAAKDLLS
jgi:uncharacterized protein YjbJ (UPF0337 family)